MGEIRIIKRCKMEIKKEMWEKIKSVLIRAADALDDAGGVVDPGDEEQVAYEGELEDIKELLKEMEGK
jgi:hypothetical protein